MTTRLKIDDLHIDPRLQSRRDGVCGSTVSEYAEAIRRGSQFPAIVAYTVADRDYGRPAVVSGFHRIAAYKIAGIAEVEVELRSGTFNEAWLAGWLSNLTHGLRYTNADKRAATERALAMYLNDSTVVIAERIGVSDEFVRKIRNDMTTAGKIEKPERVVGKDGREQKSNKHKTQVPTVGTCEPESPLEVPKSNNYKTQVPTVGTCEPESPNSRTVTLGTVATVTPESSRGRSNGVASGSGDMDEIDKLLKRIRQIVKKKPELAKDAAVSLHEMGEEVILFQPELQYGEQRPIYESTYFRVKQGQYEGPTVQRIEGKGDLAIDTYGRPVPMSLRDEFCDSRYQKLGAHLERAVSELHSADEVYSELSARAMGVQWFPTQEWNKSIIKGAKIISDGLAAWMNDALPYAVCRFCNGLMKDAEGNRCKKCKFSGFWPRSEALAYPTMIENKRPKPAI